MKPVINSKRPIRSGTAASLDRMVSRSLAYVGESVVIEWWPETGADWPTFRVLAVQPERHRIWLRGEANLEGCQHDGDDFWVPIADIKTMNARPTNAQVRQPAGQTAKNLEG